MCARIGRWRGTGSTSGTACRWAPEDLAGGDRPAGDWAAGGLLRCSWVLALLVWVCPAGNDETPQRGGPEFRLVGANLAAAAKEKRAPHGWTSLADRRG